MKRMIPLMLTVLLLVCALSGTALAAENQFHFDKNVRTVFEGETLQLILVRAGDCADPGELTYTTSSKKIATIDENGVVTGLTKGQVTITATLKGAKRTWTTTLSVTVARKVETIEVTGTKLTVYEPDDPLLADILDPTSAYGHLPVLMLQMGKAQTITATCGPSTATNRKWQLTSSDESIVKAGTSTLTPKGTGECLVTVQSVQNPEVCQQYRALVVQPVTSVKITSAAKTLYVEDSIALTANITPANATVQEVTWSSSRPDNATVDENGIVTGVSKGSAEITARAADGSGRYSTFTVTVRQQAEQITLKQAEYAIKAGKSITLWPTVSPDTTNDKSVAWSSSDTSVVKVNSEGRVTAVSAGTAIITCQSKTHPQVYAQAIVRVYQPVQSISFTDKSPYVAVGESIRLSWTVKPSTATDTSVTFSTNKPEIVSVSQDGTVTGLKRGECYVYATANDGSGVKGSIKVQVTQPVEGVSVKNEECTVGVGDKVTNSAIFYPDDASITNMTWTSQDETIATVSGTGKKATVTGRGWGETTIIGVTEDGSYVTTFKVKVGDANKPLTITGLYVEDDNVIRIQVYNASNLTIDKFYFEIETYDAWGNPVVCNDDGRSNDFGGSYSYTLEPGGATRHGRFSFGGEFNRPARIGMVTMRITGYQTADGERVSIKRANQVEKTWRVRILGE